MRKVTYVCERCGSDNVVRDANAVWSVEDQRWELGGCMDAAYCEACDRETRLNEKESV